MDVGAFSTIYRALQPALRYFAEQILNDRNRAEEVVADVFEKLVTLGKLDEIENIKSYLYTATRNRCLDILEQDKIRYQHHQKILQETTVISEDNILKEIYLAEALREIYAAVQQLPRQPRKVIQMTYQEGLSTNEIAEALGISLSAVKTYRARGLAMLRSLISKRALAVALLIIGSRQL